MAKRRTTVLNEGAQATGL